MVTFWRKTRPVLVIGRPDGLATDRAAPAPRAGFRLCGAHRRHARQAVRRTKGDQPKHPHEWGAEREVADPAASTQSREEWKDDPAAVLAYIQSLLGDSGQRVQCGAESQPARLRGRARLRACAGHWRSRRLPRGRALRLVLSLPGRRDRSAPVARARGPARCGHLQPFDPAGVHGPRERRDRAGGCRVRTALRHARDRFRRSQQILRGIAS